MAPSLKHLARMAKIGRRMNGGSFRATGARLVACAVSLHLCASLRAQEPQAAPASASASASASSTSDDAAKGKKSCRPEYPEPALRAKAEGTTVVKLTISATGVETADVAKSAGPTPEHKILDEAAIAAILSCPFKVGVDATGHAVGTSVEIDYAWKLGKPPVGASGVQ